MTRQRAGQSLIETCVVLGLVCLLFFGLLQVSQLSAAREVLYHAAARAARAKTVGFNAWMVRKCVLVASIPNSGRLLTPDFENIDPLLRDLVATRRPGEAWDEVLANTQPSSLQYSLERARIPDFLDAENEARARYVLDYEGWDGLSTPSLAPGSAAATNRIVEMFVGQRYNLWVPLHRAFYAADSVNLEGTSRIENHYPLYLDDRYW
jgi:hypothetical protein